MIYNDDTRVIDLTVGQLRDILHDELLKALAENVRLTTKPPQYASSISEVARLLRVSRTTALSMVHRHPKAVERLSPRRYRYNITELVM